MARAAVPTPLLLAHSREIRLLSGNPDGIVRCESGARGLAADAFCGSRVASSRARSLTIKGGSVHAAFLCIVWSANG